MEEVKRAKRRSKILHGKTFKTEVGCGKLFVTVNEDDEGGVFEVFIKLGKSGSCQTSWTEGVGKMISLLFRVGADPDEVVKHLKGIRCPSPRILDKDDPENNHSCCDAIGRILEEYLEVKQESEEKKKKTKESEESKEKEKK